MKTATIQAGDAVERLRKLTKMTPVAAIALGSGVEVLNDLTEHVTYTFQEIFGISPTVEGHSGSISVGKLEGKPIAVLRGRFHFYEGYDLETVTLPTRVIAEWGVPNFYLTNACGGLNPALSVGDLMLITGYRDHINPRWRELGGLPALMAEPVDCQNESTKHLLKISKELANKDNEQTLLHTGVYAGWLGPNYETLAEVAMLKKLAADTVGMSTVPELDAASKTKTKAAAIAVITNSWAQAKIHGHKEVLLAAKAASERLDMILRTAILSQST